MMELFAACCVINGPVFYRLVVERLRARDAANRMRPWVWMVWRWADVM